MITPDENGGIIGPTNTPTSSAASGIWSLAEQNKWAKQGAWPGYSYSIDYLVVAGGGGGGGSLGEIGRAHV